MSEAWEQRHSLFILHVQQKNYTMIHESGNSSTLMIMHNHNM
jgi:hypothetical protein